MLILSILKKRKKQKKKRFKKLYLIKRTVSEWEIK